MVMRRRVGVSEWIEQDAEALFAKYADSRDPKIRDRLVVMHQNLVRFLAGKFMNRGEPIEDLVQVGTIGLINAIDRFDPDANILWIGFCIFDENIEVPIFIKNPRID